ncbi:MULTISPECIES: hypothetical protein [Kordiimonas]|uniref:hypothetical protein n=1 Tax=Kordiimonas TaxID=288021 RepID=UPI00257D2800|nr:hypothetical protein [Kordiimonas sp. UBA4487]
MKPLHVFPRLLDQIIHVIIQAKGIMRPVAECGQKYEVAPIQAQCDCTQREQRVSLLPILQLIDRDQKHLPCERRGCLTMVFCQTDQVTVQAFV